MRTLLPSTLTAIASGAVALALLIEMQFLSGTLRLATSRMPIDYGPSSTVTISNSSPALVAWFGNDGLPLTVGDQVVFSTTGTLPAPLIAGTAYYIIAAGLVQSSGLFEISDTQGGAAINTSSAGSGVHTANGEQTFVATGLLGAIEEIIDKATELSSQRFTVTGCDPAVMAIVLGEQVRGRPCIIRSAWLDAETHALLEAPIIWTGNLDTAHPVHDPVSKTASVSVVANHRGVLFNRAKPIRYTHADQQRVATASSLISGPDMALEYIVAQSMEESIWPGSGWGRI